MALYHRDLTLQFDREELHGAGIDEWSTPLSRVQAPAQPLEDFLDELLSQQGLGWIVDNRVVVMTTIEKSEDVRRSKIRRLHDEIPSLRWITVDWGND